MNKDDANKLAEECGGESYWEEYALPNDLPSGFILEDSQLLAFANACEKIGMEKLLPITWTKEMSDAWHQNIPDVNAAFHELIKKAT